MLDKHYSPKLYIIYYMLSLVAVVINKAWRELLTSNLLEYLLHTAAVVMPVLLLSIHSRGRVQSSSGDVGAAAPAGVAAQAAAAAAAGGRGDWSPPGTRWRPVSFHNLILGFKTRVIPTPRLPGRWGRSAYDSSETQVLMLDVLHLYPFARVQSVGQPARLALRQLLRSDSGWTHSS